MQSKISHLSTLSGLKTQLTARISLGTAIITLHCGIVTLEVNASVFKVLIVLSSFSISFMVCKHRRCISSSISFQSLGFVVDNGFYDGHLYFLGRIIIYHFWVVVLRKGRSTRFRERPSTRGVFNNASTSSAFILNEGAR